MTDEKVKESRQQRRKRQRELYRAQRKRPGETDHTAARDPATAAPGKSQPPSPSNATTKLKIKESDITGLKYFDQLAPLLARLNDDACERDKAGNRERHFDQYCMLILLFLFNPHGHVAARHPTSQ